MTTKMKPGPERTREAASAKLRGEIKRFEGQHETLDERAMKLRTALGNIRPGAEERIRARALEAGEDSWEAIKEFRGKKAALEAELAEHEAALAHVGQRIETLKAEAAEAEYEAVRAAAVVIHDRQRARFEKVVDEIQAVIGEKCAALFEANAADEAELDEWRPVLENVAQAHGGRHASSSIASGVAPHESPEALAKLVGETVAPPPPQRPNFSLPAVPVAA